MLIDYSIRINFCDFDKIDFSYKNGLEMTFNSSIVNTDQHISISKSEIEYINSRLSGLLDNYVEIYSGFRISADDWLYCFTCGRFFQAKDLKLDSIGKRQRCAFENCNSYGFGSSIYLWNSIRSQRSYFDKHWPKSKENNKKSWPKSKENIIEHWPKSVKELSKGMRVYIF